MHIKPDQLCRQLQKNISPLYTLFGDEPLLMSEAADLIRSTARQQGYTEREIFTIDHRFNWLDLQHASNNRSLFGDRRIMDLRIPSGKPGREGSKAIEAYCHALSADTITLVTLPRIDKQSQSTKWFKTLESTGVTVPFYPMERARLPVWIEQRLAMQQQKADVETVQFLADRVEGHLLAAHQEIIKLALLYPIGLLSFNQVKDAVLEVARYDVFKLSEAMLAANTARYVHILEELRGEGTAPPLILATLAEQIRSLILIRQGLDAGKPMVQLMREARVWGPRQKLMEHAAKRIGLDSLIRALLHAAKIDKISKGVSKGDTWDELLQLGQYFIENKRY
ncbi:MAG: DNA polymerase III subunit delta [Nitrosomonas sp.]|nr:DNA polymerase III subunit delta [Nitrosomonas sp.]MDP1951233.1 DNA polymerase III subunit delta [Nitrosomonas sp.]